MSVKDSETVNPELVNQEPVNQEPVKPEPVNQALKDSQTNTQTPEAILQSLGWSHFFQQQWVTLDPDLIPARISRQDINQYLLVSTEGDMVGQLPGRFRQSVISKADLPTVGDWVLVSHNTSDEPGKVTIEHLLERKSKFSRKEAGDVVDEQIIAANIDTAFIVSALDDDFNPKRIERYLLLSWDSGASPVIVLNKADVCDDVQARVEELQAIAKGTPIHVMSAIDATGIDALRTYIHNGTTCALMGSSGVGKSTIINALLGYDRFATSSVRETDSKGRHTTTFREMVRLPDSGLIIDTPGMREIQVWADEASLQQTFGDIEELTLHCRFTDCKHDREPGCAINAAIKSGALEADRLERYHKLLRELQFLEERQNLAAKAEKKQSRKKFARLIRNRPDKRNF